MAKKIVDETLKFDVIINGDKAKKEYGQLERATKKLLDTNSDLEKQAKKLEKANKQNSAEYVALRKEIENNNKTLKKNEGRLQELTKEIGVNNLSMRQLGREARKLNGIMANLDPNSQEWAAYNTQLQSIKGRMANLRQEMRPVAESMEEQLGAVNALTAGFGQFFSGLRSGDLGAARAGLNAVTTSISGATRASLAFIATPIGAAITVLAGVGLAAREWFNYNQQAREAIILTQQITGLQGVQADAARLQAQAISETFNTDFTETLRTASILSKQFNISFSEALDEINAGLVQGQAVNDEYFDSLKEYPTFFASAGFSATEFRKTIEQGYDLGIYQDKLPDAIKEVDLSLREQTKATTEALQNAFGAAFTESILSRIRTGEITTKQALKEISAEADKTGLNVQQNAQLTADLFGRAAGEDAGGAIVVLNAFNKSLSNTAEVLTPLEQQLKRVSDANLELAKAQDEALKSDSYVAFTNDMQIFWTQIKTGFYNALGFVSEQFAKAQEFMVSFLAQNIVTFNTLPTIAKLSFTQLKNEVWDVVKTFNGLADVVDNLLSFNFDAAKDSFTSFKNDFKKEVTDVAGVANGAIDLIKKGRAAAAQRTAEYFNTRRAAANEQTNSVAAPISTPGSGTGGSGSSGGGNTSLSPEDKAKLDSKKRLYTMLDAMEAERQIQDQLKKVEKDQRAQEEEVLRIEQKFQKLTEEAAGEQELITRLEEEKQAQLQAVRDKYAEEQLEKDKAVKAAAAAQQKELVENLIAAEENLVAARENAAIRGIGIMRNFVGENNAAGKALFALQKAIAIGQIISQMGKANAGAVANEALIPAFLPPGIPNPIKTVSAATTAKTIAANKIAAATQIATIAAEGIAGFQDGLYPMMRNDGKTFNTRFGGAPNTQIVTAPTHFIAGEVKPEMIIDGDTFRKMDPSVTGYILSLAGKAPGFENGMYPKTNEQNNAVLQQLTGAVAMLTERLNMPIVAENYYGAEASQRQAEVDKQLRNIKNNAKIRKDGI